VTTDIFPEASGSLMAVLVVNCHRPLFVVLILNTVAPLPLPPTPQPPHETPIATNAVPLLSIITSALTFKGCSQ
jgi:hypothetical protein